MKPPYRHRPCKSVYMNSLPRLSSAHVQGMLCCRRLYPSPSFFAPWDYANFFVLLPFNF